MLEKISIIVPVYNSAKYLDECIQSLLNQDYPNIEIVLVDDGSTDESLEICLSYQEHSPKCVVLQQKNLGAAVARRNGVFAANGDWVVFVDSDDTVEPNLISSLYSFSDGVDVVFSPLTKLHFIKINRALSQEEYLALLLARRICLGPVCKLFKKKLLTYEIFDLPKELVKGEDWAMNVRFARKIKLAKQCPEHLYHYRQVGTSLVHSNKTTAFLTRLQIKVVLESLTSAEKRKMKKEIWKMKYLMWKYFLVSNLALRTRIKRLLRWNV